MKALVLEGLHQPLAIKEVSTPSLQPGEVLVQVKAAALNHRDVWIQKGQYGGIKYPSILGSDGAGVVVEAFSEAEKHWVGKEIIINPSHNWGNNPKGQGKSFKILGLPDEGTFAQYVKVATRYLADKPAHLSFEEAAALPLAGLTAYRTLISRAQVQKGEKVLITGIGGGVALFVLQYALAIGAQAYVTSSSEAKIARAKEMGAIGGTNYTSPDWADELKKQTGGFDVLIDSSAGEGFAKLVDIAAVGGRIAIYGGTQGVIKELVPQRIFWKQLSILGATMGSEEEFGQMVYFIIQHQLRPVVNKIFPWEEAEQALRRMDNKEQFGKIVLKIE
ncbi:zinc-binding dehydrogenase [Rhodocytophaga aerolata]|uniref:Zinc-binding dehydrogenase n=1 Tax=Rhodocytophaga aerolata TaxID=455078 RepID=A0ABT8R4K4_9BACT|nr:zinc-binding dehydrogenase [Rhodocytophaga aerolata]MDO1446228.1 zinc-binding dehydrogenase [Rhodocytophaga aerolata]